MGDMPPQCATRVAPSLTLTFPDAKTMAEDLGAATPVEDSAASGAPHLGRRTFLRWASAAAAALSAVLVGVPSLLAFLTPGFARPPKRAWTKIAEADGVEIGVPVKVDFTEDVNDAWVEGRALRSVWLYTEDGESFTAFSGVCTHLGCSFFFETEKKLYHCPCHHGLFDMKTGAVVGGPPPRALDTLQAKVEDGAVYVQYQLFRAGVPNKVEA